MNQLPARLGQLDRPGGAHDQCGSEVVLETSDCLTDGGAGDAHPIGCRTKIPFFRNGQKERKQIQVPGYCPVMITTEYRTLRLHSTPNCRHVTRNLREPDMDKVILITGASSGIGEGIARALGASRPKLLLGARRTDR